MEKYIKKIESILFDEVIQMEKPTIRNDLGVLIFEATLYRYSNEDIYKQKALKLLKALTETFGNRNLGSGFFEGFEGIFYVVQYLHKCGIIEDESMLEGLEEYLLQSLSIDFKNNYFDPMHGSIGKLLYYINSQNRDSEKVNGLIDQFLNSLYDHRQETSDGIFWYDKNEDNKELVNLGMAHGLTGILAFLLRLKELGYQHELIDILIDGILKSFGSFKNEAKFLSYFPDYFSEDIDQRNVNSRLGWCYGDLSTANTILYASKILERNDLKKEFLPLINSLVLRRMSNSKLDHYEDYSFFDTAFCHGLGGITYIFQKINNHLNNATLDKRIEFWKKQLLENLDKQLNVEKDIYLPWYRQNSDYAYTVDQVSVLNGLCGTGLVLLSLHYKKYDWSDFFLLF
ncbi:lanthionine synthetase LanC family protein [Aquimarina spongiae]|uniref:Lanthionine synthetase C-like protein n=1 Tax=Aquimarina spongiae TaxID=570521 RepID=A0A1M6IFC8_9FLAO|nr:lanthionine synthetase LanC family protein [Aquimarina spongiae]SHJ33149.1 Lanthionine synthetase C-like protein [Aquimarina spongiae]